jgi:hypothetical protein
VIVGDLMKSITLLFYKAAEGALEVSLPSQPVSRQRAGAGVLQLLAPYLSRKQPGLVCSCAEMVRKVLAFALAAHALPVKEWPLSNSAPSGLSSGRQRDVTKRRCVPATLLLLLLLWCRSAPVIRTASG